MLRLKLNSIELIFVDDHSPDDSVDSLLSLKQKLAESAEDKTSAAEPELTVRIIRLAQNAGQQAAVFCGLNEAKGNKILTMDDDLQHPPAYIPEFLEKSADYDLSYALPLKDGRTSILKTGSRMRDWFFRKILNCPSDITPGSFRIISRRAVDAAKAQGKENTEKSAEGQTYAEGKGRTGAFVYVSALLFRSMPNLKVQNLYFDTSAEGMDTFPDKTIKGNIQSSRIRTAARLSLYFKLIYFYSLPFKRYKTGQNAYIIRDEL